MPAALHLQRQSVRSLCNAPRPDSEASWFVKFLSLPFQEKGGCIFCVATKDWYIVSELRPALGDESGDKTRERYRGLCVYAG